MGVHTSVSAAATAAADVCVAPSALKARGVVHSFAAHTHAPPLTHLTNTLASTHPPNRSTAIQIINETLPALAALKARGLVRFVGITGLPLSVFQYVLDRAPAGLGRRRVRVLVKIGPGQS